MRTWRQLGASETATGQIWRCWHGRRRPELSLDPFLSLGWICWGLNWLYWVLGKDSGIVEMRYAFFHTSSSSREGDFGASWSHWVWHSPRNQLCKWNQKKKKFYPTPTPGKRHQISGFSFPVSLPSLTFPSVGKHQGREGNDFPELPSS